MQAKDPLFLRKLFVSHYCNIPYHLLDKKANDSVQKTGLLPKTLIEELYAGAFHLIRTFELGPFRPESGVEDIVADQIEKGKL